MKCMPPFPYTEGLTQLDIALTTLELEVATDKNFQAIRQSAVPKWGQIETGIRYKNDAGHHLYTRVTDSPSPSDAKNQAADYARFHVGLVRLVAKVMREYSGPDLVGYHESENLEQPDSRLIFDLIRWQDDPENFKGFRWEERWELLKGWAKRDDWKRRAAEFRADGGNSDLIVLLLGDLGHEEVVWKHDGLYGQLTKSCKKAMRLPEDARRGQTIRHLPYTGCAYCSRDSHTDSTYHSGPEHVRAIPMVDCGDVAHAKSWITDSSVRRTVQHVRFVIPHSTFEDCDRVEQMFASLLIFDLVKLSGKTRQMVYDRLIAWVETCRQDEIRRNKENAGNSDIPQWSCWANTVVLKPTNKQQMRAIVVAGEAVDWRKVSEAFHKGEFSRLIDGGMTVNSTEYPPL